VSTEAALLAAVLAHPDEDTPRLVYADWLDEHADSLPGRDPKEARARAEFIRLQIACEGRDEDPDFDAARERVSEIRSRYWRSWVPPFPEGEGYWGFECRRGFVEGVHHMLARFPALAQKLFALAPIRALSGSLTPEMIEPLAKCPYLQRIRSLDISGAEIFGESRLTETHIRQLFSSPHLSDLRELRIAWMQNLATIVAETVASSETFAGLETATFWQYQFPLGAAIALAQSKTLRLRRLTGWESTCGNAGAEALAQSPAISRLEWLNLGGCQITGVGATALAESPHLGPLWYLNLGGNQIRDEGVVAIAQSPRLAGLRVLELNSIRPNSDSLAALAQSKHIHNLRRLEWRNNNLRAAGTKVFADAPAFAQLRVLDLSTNGLGDGGATQLACSPQLMQLIRLNLDGCSIKEAGAKAIARSEVLCSLTHLALGRNQIGDEGAKAIAKANNFPALRELALNNNSIGDAGAIALAKSPQMETVEVLYLGSNKIGDAGAKALIDSPHCQNLKKLDFGYNKASRRVKAAVAKRFAQS